jgi:hypothetical protein
MLARLRPYVLLFLGLNVVYHANFRPIDSSDTLPASLLPFAVALDHSVTLDRFFPWLPRHVWYTPYVTRKVNGHHFSSYPIGGALLVAPLYVPVALAARHWDPGAMVVLARIAEKFSAVAIAAFSAILLLLLLKRIVSSPWAWMLTLVYALATETWSVSSQALWQHGPGNLALIGSFFGLELWAQDRRRTSWLWLCGISTAVAFVIRPTSLVLLPAIVVALLFAKATLGEHLRLLAGPVAGGLVLAAYNEYVFHRLSGGYSVGLLTGSAFSGLAGIFLSPSRGLLIYTPIAICALCAFAPSAAAMRRRHMTLFVAAVAFILLDSYSIGRSVIWWGGYCWGPRLLSELIPPLVVLMAIGVAAIDRPWPLRAFAVLAVYSMLIQAVGVFFYPNGHWDSGLENDRATAHLWDWKDNPIGRTIEGGFYWQPYSIVGAALRGGIPAAAERMHDLKANPYEEAQPVHRPRADRGLP